jgi:acylphosphatase
MSSKKVRARVIVHGRVQGVFFRYETQQAAIKRDVTGWVRNQSDGTVEAVFEGVEENVHSTLEWCRKGPPRARVLKLDVDWLSPEETDHRFEIRY